MITYLSAHVPNKVKRSSNKFRSFLTQINSLSGRDYRMYFDDMFGILVDVTKNKILWIADATFSMAILEARLRLLLEYWNYETCEDKCNVDIVRYDYIQKYIKIHYE